MTLQRLIFDEDAELYDRARPGYPAPLYEDIFTYAALGPSDRILEIGAGTGKASIDLAARGHSLLCIEPGANMARVARRTLADRPRCQVVEVGFEDWPVEEGAFALVACAQAFHWVDPLVRYRKTLSALRPGGSLAIFWNVPVSRDDELEAGIQAAYHAHAPELAERPPGGCQSAVNPYGDEISDSGLYGDVEHRTYAWSEVYSAGAYAELMGTQSNHRMLEGRSRQRLVEGIRQAIREAGDRREVDYVANVYLARRL